MRVKSNTCVDNLQEKIIFLQILQDQNKKTTSEQQIKCMRHINKRGEIEKLTIHEENTS